MDTYEWVTDEMFDAELSSQIATLTASQILAIPGVYEILREELNNDVLTALEQAREEVMRLTS